MIIFLLEPAEEEEKKTREMKLFIIYNSNIYTTAATGRKKSRKMRSINIYNSNIKTRACRRRGEEDWEEENI